MPATETDFTPDYDAWLASPGPDANAALLKKLDPVIRGAVRTHVGESNPLIFSRARRMALDGVRSYDPARGGLQNHLYNHLQGLKRVNRQQTQVVKVPERIHFDRYTLDDQTRQLADELGREPTDAELADRTGFSVKRMARVRRYNQPVAEGMMEDRETGAGFEGVVDPRKADQDAWATIVYHDLDPYHQKIMEHAFGLGGRRPLRNQDIARKMSRSPGAISQAKLRIQKLLDEGAELNPFNGAL